MICAMQIKALVIFAALKIQSAIFVQWVYRFSTKIPIYCLVQNDIMPSKQSILSKRSKFVYNVLEEDDRLAQKLSSEGKNILKLNRGDPPHYFPTPKYMVDAYIDALKAGKTGYSMNRGVPELRSEVAKRFKRLYGVDCDEDSAIITQGVSETIGFMNAALIDEGDRAILFKPYYTIYIPELGLYGGTALIEEYDEESGWQIDTDKLRKNIKSELKGAKKPKYIMLTNPNNPTGTVLSRNVLEEIVDIANEHEIFLISDEIYDEIVYNKAKFTSISQIAKGVPHAILNGASKGYDATGFRVGYILIPGNDKTSSEVRAKMEDFANARLCPNAPAQYAFAAGLANQKEHGKAIKHMVGEIEKRVNACTDEINKSEYLSTVRPNGAFYIFPKVRMEKLKIRSDRDFVDGLLREEHIQVTRGSGFGASGHIRLVALAEKEVLTSTIKRINKFCERHKA